MANYGKNTLKKCILPFSWNQINSKKIISFVKFTGRVAIAYQSGTSFQRKSNKEGPDQDQRYVNLCTAIYECESTGKFILRAGSCASVLEA